MIQAILGIVGSTLLIIIGLWKYFGRKAAERRKLAEQAKKKLDKANADGNESDFLDGFSDISH